MVSMPDLGCREFKIYIYIYIYIFDSVIFYFIFFIFYLFFFLQTRPLALQDSVDIETTPYWIWPKKKKNSIKLEVILL